MGERSNLEMALSALQDEVSGVKEYAEIVEYCNDPELKSIAQKIMNDEKQHANLLMQWVSKNIQSEIK